MKQHETTTWVDEKRGVQAYCLTCRKYLGPLHGVPDGMNNMRALAECMNERSLHNA